MNYTAQEMALLSNTDVLGYIQAENARIDAQAKAEGWSFWTLMAESLADEYANVYELEHMFAVGTLSDVHKDIWGVRPRWAFDKMTLIELRAEIESLYASAERQAELDIIAEAEEREFEELCAAENAREATRLAEEAQRAAANAKLDMLFSIQDSLMGY
tara:strand:- start:1470 stop:1946 length:477 start_codon:yes stop_codon:yes gene_type:complete